MSFWHVVEFWNWRRMSNIFFCFLLHRKEGWIAGQVLLWNHPTFPKSWWCPKKHFIASLKRHSIKNNLIFNTNFNIQRPVQLINGKCNKIGTVFSIYILGWDEFFMHVFIPFSSVVRSGASISDLSLRSKYAIVLFLISVNIFSAQLWSDTCKKFSPIEYIECTLVREQDLNQPDYEYLPDILKDGFVRYVFLKDENAY